MQIVTTRSTSGAAWRADIHKAYQHQPWCEAPRKSIEAVRLWCCRWHPCAVVSHVRRLRHCHRIQRLTQPIGGVARTAPAHLFTLAQKETRHTRRRKKNHGTGPRLWSSVQTQGAAHLPGSVGPKVSMQFAARSIEAVLI